MNESHGFDIQQNGSKFQFEFAQSQVSWLYTRWRSMEVRDYGQTTCTIHASHPAIQPSSQAARQPPPSKWNNICCNAVPGRCFSLPKYAIILTSQSSQAIPNIKTFKFGGMNAPCSGLVGFVVVAVYPSNKITVVNGQEQIMQSQTNRVKKCRINVTRVRPAMLKYNPAHSNK